MNTLKLSAQLPAGATALPVIAAEETARSIRWVSGKVQRRPTLREHEMAARRGASRMPMQAYGGTGGWLDRGETQNERFGAEDLVFADS